VSERLSFSFSDPRANLHCFGRSGGGALVLGASELIAPLRFDPEDPQSAERFEVTLDGVCTAQLTPLGASLAFAGQERRDWLCSLRGSTAAGRELEGFGCVTLGAAELGERRLRRGIWICFGAELAFAVATERGRKAGGHGEESVGAFVARGAPLVATALADPRLSSTYREDGQLLRAGLELWEDDDEADSEENARDRARALRVAGETIAAGELDEHGEPSASAAFLIWHHNGREGIGCYLVERAQ
jgi:hypothetical protein